MCACVEFLISLAHFFSLILIWCCWLGKNNNNNSISLCLCKWVNVNKNLRLTDSNKNKILKSDEISQIWDKCSVKYIETKKTTIQDRRRRRRENQAMWHKFFFFIKILFEIEKLFIRDRFVVVWDIFYFVDEKSSFFGILLYLLQI